MSNNDDKRLSKAEYFELREKRLKLVYKILYAVVAIWIAIFLSLSQSDLKITEVTTLRSEIWSTIINTPAPKLNVALDTALHSIATSSKQLKGCFV